MIAPRLSMAVAAAWLALGCSNAPPRMPTRDTGEPHSSSELMVPSTHALHVARLLPGAAERCSVAQPTRIPRAQRARVAQASLSERLPWALALDVLAYARAERTDGSGARSSREYIRFVGAERERVVAALERASERPLVWEGVPSVREPCEGELTCVPIEARFVDAQTVELSRGAWLRDEQRQARGSASDAATESACLALVALHPEAVEVSQRSTALPGSDLRETIAVLALGRDGVERAISKRYASEQAAVRALSAQLRGEDELPTLAGSAASELGRRRGDRIEQRIVASFDELELALNEQARARALASEADAPRALQQLDASDAQAVRSSFDRALPGLRRAGPTAPDVARWLELLTHAQAAAPRDDGLARRLFQLQLVVRGDAPAAFAQAERALAHNVGDAVAWQLAKRAALAHFDRERLRGELARVHGLTSEQARRMAAELTAQVARGGDYERAEWAFSTAHTLGQAARNSKRAALSLRLPLAEFPRALALLAQGAHEQSDLGLHLLATGALAEPSPADASEALWSERTSGAGRSGLVLAATTWDDLPLRSLGRSLSLQTVDGPLALAVGLEQIGARARTTIVLTGRRQGAELVVEQGSRRLRALDWERVDRLLLAPLAGLSGAVYPPDELAVTGRDATEAAAVRAAAESEPRIGCTTEALTVRCRGPLADQGAARRALLAVVRRLLARDARSLWSDEAL